MSPADPSGGAPSGDPYAMPPASAGPSSPAGSSSSSSTTPAPAGPTSRLAGPTSRLADPTSSPAPGTPPAPPLPPTSAPAKTTPSASPAPSAAPSPPPKPTTQARSSPSLAGQVVDLVNHERANAGCAPVAEEPHLDKAAQDHSDDMSARGYFSHDTPEGEHFDDRIRAAGYPRPGAENIAKGPTSAEQVMQLWMNSRGHRANILNCSLTTIGVGVNTDGWYWTQDFGY